MTVAPAFADTTAGSRNAGFDRTVPSDPPARVLPRDLKGRAALDALGTKLRTVAAHNDLSSVALTEILTEDSTAWLSEEGRMFYRPQMPAAAIEAPPDEGVPTQPDEPPAVDIEPGSTEEATGSGTGSATSPACPTSQTFALHSRASAKRVILLDFDGAGVVGTGSNTGSNPIGSGLYTGYDGDGSPGSFSTAEHAWVQEVWRQVAETYAAFDVDVTTQDGGAASRTRSSSTETSYGTRVVFTNSAQAVAEACSSACLGVAWVGTFSDIDPVGHYQPAWVFTKTTSPIIATQAASHETGHTLGLHHDGTTQQSCYAGTKAWGPIMGSAYARAISQFSKASTPAPTSSRTTSL